ncbi:MAG: tyrosine-type recombinase/integrase [Nanoarchaeota archaeon]
MVDIHNYKRQLENQIVLVQKSIISPENKLLAIKFKDYLISEGIGVAKITRYLLDVRKLDRILNKKFTEGNKEDMRKVVAEIELSGLAPESKKTFKIMMRKFYRFIRNIDERGVYPEEVKWISIALPKNHRKLPEQLLTEEDIKSIIQQCTNLRDKTLISVLAESGCRIGEIGTMQIKHVSFENYGARLTVNGKTGMRKILVINSSPYLQQWINEHPKNNDPDSYLWYSQQTPLLSYNRITDIVKRATKKAGIKKRVHCHLFRHSRATQLASIMTEACMKQYFGWGQDSKMCGIYIHMNGEATDEAILRSNGLEINKEKTKPAMQPITCLKCKTKNEPTNKFCKICGLILDQAEAQKTLNDDIKRQQADAIMEKLIMDPEILELIKKKLA